MRILRSLILTAALAAATPALADTAHSGGGGGGGLLPGSRVVKTFDFEERKLGNFESIPMYWAKVAGHGYPAYAAGRFDPSVSRSPGNSFKLEIDGGSDAFQYSPGKLAINPSADYYVLAFVKTTALQHAKAQLSAWFADKDGKLMPETAAHSLAYASPADKAGADADWHVLHLYIPGARGGDAAKSLVLQVGLLQPQQLAGPAAQTNLGRFALYQQDIKGAAWFDDIVIIQLPRVSISVPATVPANIFSPGQNVELDLSVSDVPGFSEDGASRAFPSATVRITDADGLLYGSETWLAQASDRAPWTHRYTHAPLPAGLYTATLDVIDNGKGDDKGPHAIIARRQTKFLCLPPQFNKLAHPAPEFGMTVSGGAWGTAFWPELAPILRHTQAGLVQVPVWRKEMSEEGLLRRDPPLDSLLPMLQRLDIRAIANFSEMPTALSEKIAEARVKRPDAAKESLPPTDSVLSLFDADPSLWRPYVSFLLARYANRIDWWEFGTHETPYSGEILPQEAGGMTAQDSRYRQLYARTAPELTAMLNHPSMVVPWNALFEFDAKQYPGAGLDLQLPAIIKASQLPDYIENFKQALLAAQPKSPAGHETEPVILAHLDPLDPKTYDRNERLADFAQRIVYARTASPSAIVVDMPMNMLPPGENGRHAEPDELMLVYRTLVAALGNSTAHRAIPLAPGIKAFLFERNGAGTLIAWNESADEPRVHVDLPLGSTPRLIDLMGNVRPADVDPATQLTGLNITSTPMILDGIESKTLQLRASFALSTRLFPAGAGTVRTEVMLTNPYDEMLVGTLKMQLPPGWTMDSTAIDVALRPGAMMRRAVTIRYPYSQLAGANTIQAYLTSEGKRRCDFSFPITVSSDIVELDSSSQFLPNGDLVVQEVITNIGQLPLNAQAYAQVPGYPRQQRYLLELGAGQTTIKRFVFPMSSFTGSTKETTPHDIAAALVGKTAAVGLKQIDGRTLINKTLPLQ
jgi:hypothetical protein